MSASASVTAQKPCRNVNFYLTDEMAVFQVEDQLFRVPQCIFSRLSPFPPKFPLPRGGGTVTEGRSEANPIHLPGVKALEFETLLLYLLYGTNNNFCLSQLSWAALLSIAHRYGFTNAWERAIREIYDRKPDPIPDHAMLISAAEKCNVPLQRVVPTLVAFVMRTEPLTVTEVALLSIGTIVHVAQAREDLLRKTTMGERLPEATVKKIVCGIWGVPQEEKRRFLPSSE